MCDLAKKFAPGLKTPCLLLTPVRQVLCLHFKKTDTGEMFIE